MEEKNKLHPTEETGEKSGEPNSDSANGGEKKPEHGHNWITDMYDKVNVSVDTLNYIAVGLLIFIFAVIFFASRK